MSESTEKEEDNKSFKLDVKDDEDVTTQTVTPPPPTALKKSPPPSFDSAKKRFFPTPTPIYTPSQYYVTSQMYDPTLTSHVGIDDDQKIPIVDIGDGGIDVKEEKIKNGKRFGPLIMWQANACCNFIMLFGCGILLIRYFKVLVG